MTTNRSAPFHTTGSLYRSKSAGILLNLSDSSDTFCIDLNGKANHHAWQPVPQKDLSELKNPFWDKLSDSNPFLEDIVEISSRGEHVGKLLDHKTQEEPNNDDAVSISSEEDDVGSFMQRKHKTTNQSGKWRSASDILDDLQRRGPKRTNSFNPPGLVLNPDFNWLKNDKEAYKMAWLSHRQLTRSCLDLNLMNQSPGWGQTQATNSEVISKIGPHGGIVHLSGSKISMHVPKGHIPPGEVQEISLKAMLEPPPGLNNNHMTTLSPLLEVLLSNINTNKSLSIEMKLSGEVKKDLESQVTISVHGLVSSKREGPYIKTSSNCTNNNSTIQIELHDLKTHFFVTAVAEASTLQSSPVSVWDWLNRPVTFAVYGPKFIHPSMKIVVVVCCYEHIPLKLPFTNAGSGNRNPPPVVFQLWGKHSFKPDKLDDFDIEIGTKHSLFEVKDVDRVKAVPQSQLKIGTVMHLPITLSCSDNTSVAPFILEVCVRERSLPEAPPVASFQVYSPPATPEKLRHRLYSLKRMEIASPIPEEKDPDVPELVDQPVDLELYGVALKTVTRYSHAEYLLEYFKGETIAILSKETVRSVGNLKVKEWYVGYLRGWIGLVHCKNVKLITKAQVIDFTGIRVMTKALLDKMMLPFWELTYMYSTIQTLVTEQVKSCRSFADAVGYEKLSLKSIAWKHTQTMADATACVLEKLKGDCHAEGSDKKFLVEVIKGLLKMNQMNTAKQIIHSTVILSAAVELGFRWREFAEKIAKLSSSRIKAYEVPHENGFGIIDPQHMWKPAHDFLHTWSLQYGESYKEMVQDLHLILDKMKNPVTRHWRTLTGVLVTINCIEVFQNSAFPQT